NIFQEGSGQLAAGLLIHLPDGCQNISAAGIIKGMCQGYKPLPVLITRSAGFTGSKQGQFRTEVTGVNIIQIKPVAIAAGSALGKDEPGFLRLHIVEGRMGGYMDHFMVAGVSPE